MKFKKETTILLFVNFLLIYDLPRAFRNLCIPSDDFVEDTRAHALNCPSEAKTPLLHSPLGKKYAETRLAVVHFSSSVTLAV